MSTLLKNEEIGLSVPLHDAPPELQFLYGRMDSHRRASIRRLRPRSFRAITLPMPAIQPSLRINTAEPVRLPTRPVGTGNIRSQLSSQGKPSITPRFNRLSKPRSAGRRNLRHPFAPRPHRRPRDAQNSLTTLPKPRIAS
jgi:hypothetical protein